MNQPDFSLGHDSLLPAIAQDSTTNEVLMVAWMNQEAYEDTVRSGFATYYSRSRKRLWRKGEESGHRQRVTEIRIDCDADCILMLVEQTGAACHNGYTSCFYRKLSDGQYAIDRTPVVDPDQVYKKTRS